MSTQHTLRARRAALCCACALILGAVSARAAEDADPTLRDFQLSGQYVLHLDGKLVGDTKIYHSRRGAAYLLVADELEGPVVVLQRLRRVEALKTEDLIDREGGGFDLKARALIPILAIHKPT